MVPRPIPAVGATVFSQAEHACIAEVFGFYDLTPAQERKAWAAIERAWRDTSGRFYAYLRAHEIAANHEKGVTP